MKFKYQSYIHRWFLSLKGEGKLCKTAPMEIVLWYQVEMDSLYSSLNQINTRYLWGSDYLIANAWGLIVKTHTPPPPSIYNLLTNPKHCFSSFFMACLEQFCESKAFVFMLAEPAYSYNYFIRYVCNLLSTFLPVIWNISVEFEVIYRNVQSRC